MEGLILRAKSENSISFRSEDKEVFVVRVWNDTWIIGIVRHRHDFFIKGNITIRENDGIAIIKDKVLTKVGGYTGLNSSKQSDELVLKQVREYFVEITFKGELYYLLGNPSTDISTLLLDKGGHNVKHMGTIRNAFKLKGEPVSNVVEKIVKLIK
ncbi:hypothetical protein D3C76_1145770 [compost metagenome]